MPKNVPIDRARLRAAVADQRYWRTSHPERQAWRAWVDEGYRALYAQGAVPDGGVVHVRAYTRDGHTVSAHTRSATSRGGADSGSSAPAATGNEMVHPIGGGLVALPMRRLSLLEGSAVIPAASRRRPDEILGRRNEMPLEGGGGGGGAHRAPIGQGSPVARPAPRTSPRSQELVDMVAPSGQPVGTQLRGATPDIRSLPGGQPAAEAMLGRLMQGRGATEITPRGHPGRMYRLDDGTIIGYRPAPRSGSPAIDINIPGFPGVSKLHF